MCETKSNAKDTNLFLLLKCKLIYLNVSWGDCVLPFQTYPCSFFNPAERALCLTDPDDFVVQKNYACGLASNHDFL